MKRPSFQFYPDAWMTNQKLRRCSPAARGAWLDIMCVLHDCDEYGVARYPLRELCRAAGVDLKHARELVEKGVLKGSDTDPVRFTWAPTHAGRKGAEIALVESDGGPCWYCSRFVEDEHKRQERGKYTRFDGGDNQPNRKPKPPIGDGKGDGDGYGPPSPSPSPTTPESLSEGTRDARAPAREAPPSDTVGTFEGHADPQPAAPNPVAPLAIALNRAGFNCTALNPDLIAYHGDGGTADHLAQVAAHPDCRGKPATYVVRFARRELNQPAAAITAGNRHEASSRPPRLGLADRHSTRHRPDDGAIDGEAIRIDP